MCVCVCFYRWHIHGRSERAERAGRRLVRRKKKSFSSTKMKAGRSFKLWNVVAGVHLLGPPWGVRISTFILSSWLHICHKAQQTYGNLQAARWVQYTLLVADYSCDWGGKINFKKVPFKHWLLLFCCCFVLIFHLQMAQDRTVVFFDLETTGLGTNL